ncbi:PGPGW domain-containing protein [Actinomadura syzygii]|nr:PGPGW domain-containing protein [Actinomadura syzygii]
MATARALDEHARGRAGRRRSMGYVRHARRGVVIVVGGLVLLGGVALLVLPGPGLLLVLAGLLILAREFPAVDKYVEPVRDRAIQAAEESVTSWWKLTGSILTGLALLGAGVAWGLVDELPFSGWSAGSGLILSGIILFALLIWSHRRVRAARAARRA